MNGIRHNVEDAGNVARHHHRQDLVHQDHNLALQGHNLALHPDHVHQDRRGQEVLKGVLDQGGR